MKPFEKAVATLGALNRHELIKLRDLIDNLLAIEEPGDLETAEISANQKSALGHVELKTINGYGPYKYLRRWHWGRIGGQHTAQNPDNYKRNLKQFRSRNQ